MGMILYTKNDCPKCVLIKNYIRVELPDDLKNDIEIRNIDNVSEFKRELMMHGAYDAVQTTMPVMVDTESEEVLIGALEIKAHLKDATKTLEMGY